MNFGNIIKKIHLEGKGKITKQVTAAIVAFSLLVVISVSSALFLGTKGIVAKEMLKTNAGVLSQLEQYVDIQLVDNVYSIINDNFIDFDSNKALTEFFYSNKCSMKSYYRLLGFVSNIKNGNDFIDSIYIYSSRNDSTISSSDGLLKEALLSNYSNVPAIHSTMKKSKSRRFWITPSENGNHLITCVQIIPVINFEKSEGFIAINIDVENMVKSVSDELESCEMAIMLPDGRLLAHSNLEQLAEGRLDMDKTSQLFSLSLGSTTERINGQIYSIIWQESNKTYLKYAMLFPEGAYNNRIRILMLYCFGIVIAMLLIVVVASYYLSKFIMTPVYNNATYLEGKLVHDIIHGSSVNDENVKRRLAAFDAVLDFDKYYLVMFSASKLIFDNLDLAGRERVANSAFDFIKEYFNENGKAICSKETLSEIVIVFNTSCSRSEVTVICCKALAILREKCKMEFNVAISDTCYKVEYINNSFESVCKTLEYGYVFGYNKVLDFAELKKIESHFSGLSSKQQKDMEGWLREGDITSFSKLINDIFKTMKDGKYSISSVKSILIQIVSIIQRIGDEKSLFGNSKESALQFSYWDKIQSLDEFAIWVNILLEQFEESVQNRSINRHRELIANVDRYIVENIGVEITLNSVADAMKISPNYLSKIFKDERGVSFSNFLSDKKLERAEELLVTTKKSVSEIVKIVGYANEAYFTKLFKKKYGDTPGSYRKRK